MVSCNQTVVELGQKAVAEEVPIVGKYSFHYVALGVSGLFAVVAVVCTIYLMMQHALHYSRPWEQRHIIRILFMIPVYATVSFISFLDFTHAIYYEVVRDCYEAFAISSFFALLCSYVDTNLHDQKNYFRRLRPKNWTHPVKALQFITGGPNKGPFRIPRSGLTWFNIVWFCVFQYCFIRVTCTVVALIAQLTGAYCEVSLSPIYLHFWVMAAISISVTVAMYCLIQFYIQLKDQLSEHNPFIKVLCIKLVVFFSFWQSFTISVLSAKGPLKPTKYIAYADIRIGLPSALLCFEMALFSILLFWAFPYGIYTKSRAGGDTRYPSLGPLPAPSYYGGKGGIKALIDAFNIWDIVKAAARGFRWIFVGARHRHLDSSYTSHRSNLATDFRHSESGPSMAMVRPGQRPSTNHSRQSFFNEGKSSRASSAGPLDPFADDADPRKRSSASSKESVDTRFQDRHQPPQYQPPPPYQSQRLQRDRSQSRGRPRISTASAHYGLHDLGSGRNVSLSGGRNQNGYGDGPLPYPHQTHEIVYSRSVQPSRENSQSRTHYPHGERNQWSSPSSRPSSRARNLTETTRPQRAQVPSLPPNPRPSFQAAFPAPRALSQAATARPSSSITHPPRSHSQAHTQGRSYYQPSRVSRENWDGYENVDLCNEGDSDADSSKHRFSFRRPFASKP